MESLFKFYAPLKTVCEQLSIYVVYSVCSTIRNYQIETENNNEEGLTNLRGFFEKFWIELPLISVLLFYNHWFLLLYIIASCINKSFMIFRMHVTQKQNFFSTRISLWQCIGLWTFSRHENTIITNDANFHRYGISSYTLFRLLKAKP